MDKLERVIDKFESDYSNTLSSAILVGSTVYLGKIREGGDVDVVVTMSDISEWQKACGFFCVEKKSEIIKESIDLFNQGRVQYFSLKPVIYGIPFSIDFILKSMLEDFIDNFDSWMAKKIYKTSVVKQGRYLTFGRVPDTVTVKKENIHDGILYLINSPLGKVSKNRFYHGILLGKFLGGYHVAWDNCNSSVLIERFCKTGIEKYASMNQINNVEDILKSLNRYDAWSNMHLERQIRRYKRCLVGSK
jgi:hypothetical protein